jgi:hypothetical protein
MPYYIETEKVENDGNIPADDPDDIPGNHPPEGRDNGSKKSSGMGVVRKLELEGIMTAVGVGAAIYIVSKLIPDLIV